VSSPCFQLVHASDAWEGFQLVVVIAGVFGAVAAAAELVL